MSNISNLFYKSGGSPVKYKGKTVQMKDDFPFTDGELLCVSIEKTNSSLRQGIILSLFGKIQLEDLNELVNEQTLFWEDTAPKYIFIRPFSSSQTKTVKASLPLEGFIGIKNVWDVGEGRAASWIGSAGMVIEEIENGKRYFCNDGACSNEEDGNFNSIIFTVTRKVDPQKKKPQ